MIRQKLRIFESLKSQKRLSDLDGVYQGQADEKVQQVIPNNLLISERANKMADLNRLENWLKSLTIGNWWRKYNLN